MKDRLTGLFGNSNTERIPAPEVMGPDEIEELNVRWLKANERGPSPEPDDDPMFDSPFAKFEDGQSKARFPWLHDPERGVKWDFDPIELRNLAQPNTWVGMLIQSITGEIAQVPITVVKSDGNEVETAKRLETHPELRKQDDGVEDLPDFRSEQIYELLQNPNPDDMWQDMVEMWMADLLEVGSLSAVKVFPRGVFDADENLTVDPTSVRPRALQTSAPEVWTKEYDSRTGLLEGYWQFDHHSSPGTGGGRSSTRRSIKQPIAFDADEVVWHDIHKRSNRRYGLPPTLLVKDFLALLDLAVEQEQNYFGKGAIPNGALIGEG
ncbi:MAG: hypothetical protein ACOCTH_03910, partial [Halodesulfurarchaeum sp.]